MTDKVYSEARSSSDDIALTAEANGETYTIYIGSGELSKMSKDEFARVMGDYLSCLLCCTKKSGFAACMARCVAGDGKCCDSGATNCE